MNAQSLIAAAYEGMDGMLENTFINVKNRSKKNTAEIEVPDGGGFGNGGKAILSIDGKTVAEGRIDKTQPLIFSADETADVGLDNQTPVASDIGYGTAETKFTGMIHQVVLVVK